jgi:hypothetical protein
MDGYKHTWYSRGYRCERNGYNYRCYWTYGTCECAKWDIWTTRTSRTNRSYWSYGIYRSNRSYGMDRVCDDRRYGFHRSYGYDRNYRISRV